MKNSRLTEILRTFSKEEMSTFSKFLHSPFVRTRRNIQPLMSLLIKHHPDFSSAELEKENLFTLLFPREEYSDKKLANLTSDLTKEAENFLKHITLDNDEVESLILTGKAFYNKRLPAHTNRMLKIIESKLKPGFSSNKDYFTKLKQVYFLRSAFHTLNNEFDELIECKRKHFEASAVQFIIDQIQLMSSMDAAMSTYGEDMESNFVKAVTGNFDIDKVLTYVSKSDFEYKDLLELHYYFLKTIKHPEEKSYYFKLRDNFYNNLELFDREEKYFVFSHLANYCTEEVAGKNEAFYAEALDVYKRMLENNAYSYSESEFMQVISFRNVIYFCNTMKDLVWFEHLIENHMEVLSPDHREDMKNFALANLQFLKREFEKSLVNISKIENDFFLFKSDLRNLLLKIYYELGYIEQAYSMIDSYKHFLSNTNEIPEEYKEFYRKFLNRYVQLLRVKSGKSKDVPEMILREIVKETKIVNKNWLIEKAGELM